MNLIFSQINSDQKLLRHAKNVNSISGEDGIIEKIFTIVAPINFWCVEFGAWDGRTYSNTCNLLTNADWNGLFIEADPVRFQDLAGNYAGNSRVKCVNCFVTFTGHKSLDNILQQAGAPKEFDLLSIDIDGNDYHIWDALRDFSPRVVIIEFNPTIPSHVEFVQPRDMSVNQGSSPLSLIKLGKQKGYELISVTEHNLIFVKSELFSAFGIVDNSLVRLRPTQFPQPYIFQLYDGTFVVGDIELMAWHGIPIRQEKFQVLPKIFRRYPPRPRSIFMRILRKCWLFFYLKGLA